MTMAASWRSTGVREVRVINLPSSEYAAFVACTGPVSRACEKRIHAVISGNDFFTWHVAADHRGRSLRQIACSFIQGAMP
jgi:hypothetical protein